MYIYIYIYIFLCGTVKALPTQPSSFSIVAAAVTVHPFTAKDMATASKLVAMTVWIWL